MADISTANNEAAKVYEYFRKIKDSKITSQEAATELSLLFPHKKASSFEYYFRNINNMYEGKRYSMTMPRNIIIFAIEQIGKDYGIERLHKAIESTYQFINYRRTKYSQNYDDLQDDCQEIALKNNITIKDIADIPSTQTSPKSSYPKNLILYGPPGTGKTYNTINYALAIIENKTIEEINDLDRQELIDRFNEYKSCGLIEFCTFHQSYGYEEFIEGIKPVINEGTCNISYKVQPGIFKKFCTQNNTDKIQTKVFIIDEINRGNISKIFGELITLIEDTKRIGEEEETLTRLPYSGELFGIPNNIYIIGTMNTADRSIALIDTALRRRFEFTEMQPKPHLLENVLVEGINIQTMLDKINRRIEVLYDRDHTIGHSFFMKLLKEENRNIDVLKKIFKLNILPLLKEYFYDDYEKIALVLNDDLRKNNETSNFIIKQADNYADIINANNTTILPAYTINEKALSNPEAYIKIYNR